MEATAVSGGVGYTTNDSTDRAKFNREQFLTMLISELQNQDPLDPMDNGKFLEQLMQMQQLESSAALSDGISSLLKFQTMSTASGMIGKTIQGIGDNGSSVNGVVEKVSLLNGEVRLVVGGTNVSLGNVQSVNLAPAQG